MRYAPFICLVAATNVFAAIVGPDGVDSLGLDVDGTDVLIGQTEFRRSGKDGYDADEFSSSNTVPTGVYFQNNAGMAPVDTFLDEHATIVAQQMIGTGLQGGVAPGASLHSIGVSDQNDDDQVALAMNRLALLNNGQVTAINMSFYAIPGFFDDPDGNSHLTQFVDWSSRQHDVLYVVAWGNVDSADDVRKPADNYNGITVAASEIVDDDGPYRRFSTSVNANIPFNPGAQRIDILAPGSDILALRWTEIPDFVNGTSFATPHVTGTVALLQEHAQDQINANDPRFGTNSKRHQVMKAVILNSADKLSGVHGSSRTVLDANDNDWTMSEAFNFTFTALDDQMGAGHLKARRAILQLSPGEYGPGMIPNIGWDYGSIGGAGSQVEYTFESQIGGGYLAVTLAWDRQTTHTETCGGGTYCQGDQFISGELEDRANDLDLWLLPAESNDLNDAVAASVVSDDTLEHIFFDDFSSGNWKIVVSNSPTGMGSSDNYALAWWFGNASPQIQGDYNSNGSVGPEDYDEWKSNFGMSVAAGSGADGNGNGIVDAADYTVWRDHLGQSAGAGSFAAVAVPEPSSLMLLVVRFSWFGGKGICERQRSASIG